MELLFENFEFLADAPNGVQKLRELILQLAVQGKLAAEWRRSHPELVEGSHSAGALLEKINSEKEKQITKGKIKKDKPLPPVGEDEKPYTLPDGWEWVRLGEVTNYGRADKIESNKLAKDSWVLELEDIEKVTSRLLNKVRHKDRMSKSTKNIFFENDVLFGKLRPYLDKVVVADENGVCTTEILPLRGYYGIYPAFLRISLKCPFFVDYANSSTHGMNLPRLGTDKGREALFALPPLEEQKRIVAKVDQLMALCDELEKQKERRAKKRVRINKAAIHLLLESKERSEFNANWRRIQDNFALLYDVPENVAQLKQAILQLAVQGKLTSEWRRSHPELVEGAHSASTLLEKIKAEKEKLIAEGKIKKQKPLPPIGDDEKPYDLPRGWEWVKISHLTNVVRGGSPRPAGDPTYYTGSIPFLKVADLTKDENIFLYSYTYSIKEAGLYKTRFVESNTLMLTNSGATLGIPKICTFPTTFNDGVAAFINFPVNLDKVYFYHFLKSKSKWFLETASRGQGQPNLNTEIIKETPFALPPLEEQKRIVAKVDALMHLCDDLETGLSKSQQTAGRLMNAVAQGAMSRSF